MQCRYRLRALSEFVGSRPPAPAPALSLAAARRSTYSLTLSADTSPHVELHPWRGQVETREEPREDLGVTGDLDRIVLLQRVPGRAP